MDNDNRNAITIDVDRNNLFYYSGETISGIVRLNITEENLETHEIYISLNGEIGYTINRSLSNGKTRYLLRSEYHKIKFYYKKFHLSESNITQQEFIHDQGQYLWSYQFPLINNLPPAINQPDVFPRVRYYLQVIIDKPWYKSNIKYKKYLTIYPRINLLQNPQCLSASIFECENRKDITLKAIFNKLGYVEGENIQFTIEIQNPQKVLILYTNLSMVKYYQIENNFDESIIYKIILPKIINLTNEQIIETFTIKIPSVPFPPSYKSQQNSNVVVHIYYILKITVKVKGIFTNFNINIPITLGTEPNYHLNQQQTLNPLNISYSSNYEQSICNDDDDLPPDYNSIVQHLQ